MRSKMLIASLAGVLLLTAAQALAADPYHLVRADNIRQELGIKDEAVKTADELVRIDFATGVSNVTIQSLLNQAIEQVVKEVFPKDTVFPLKVRSPGELTKLEESVQVAGKGNVPPHAVACFVDNPVGVIHPTTVYGRLIVAVGPIESDQNVDKLLTATKKALLDAIRKEEQKHKEKVQALLAASERDAETAKRRFEEVRDRQAELMALSELPYEVLQDSVASLQREKQSIQLELVGLQAREAAIQEQVKAAAERAKSGPSAEIIDNLAEILSVRQRDLERATALEKAASVSQQEVLQAREQLLMAKIELAKARAGATASAPQVDRFNTDLAQVSIDTTVAKARLEFVQRELEEQLARSREQRKIEEELQDLDTQIREARKNLESARQSVKNVTRSLAGLDTTTIEVIKREELPN